MTPAVSVVMAAYNGAGHVAEAVRSILEQDMADLELIVVDDGSTDGTAEIVAAVADPRLRLVRGPCNQGIAAAANIGLALARGAFVARMDSDDVAVPDRLSAQLAFMERHPEVDVCGGGMEIFGDIAQVVGVPVADADIKANFLAARGNIFNPTAFFRRDLVDRDRLRYDPNLPGAEDLAFWIAAMRAGARFANLDRTLVRYRWHGANVSASGVVGRAVRRIRPALVRDFFPQLTGYQAAALAALLAEARPLPAGVADAVAAALRPIPTIFGESRRRLAQIVQAQADKLAVPAA